MTFEILFYFAAFVTVLALFRLRPALFTVAANQVVVIRSLIRIEKNGQPPSQSFIPRYVFAQNNLDIALDIFMVVTVILLIFVLLPAKKRQPIVLPRLPKYVLPVLLGYFLLLALSTKAITEEAYAAEGQIVYGGWMRGAVQIMFYAVLIYILRQKVLSGEIKGTLAFVWVFLLCFLTDFSRGTTGLAIGILCASLFFLFAEQKRKDRVARMKMVATIGAIFISLTVLTTLVRSVRARLTYEGWGAVPSAINAIVASEESEGQNTGESGDVGNSIGYAAHVLECISLYERGINREWRSIYAPLEYTFKPSFLVKPLGLVRSQEAAWELSDYYIQGGGIYTFGEFYWNGGMLCVLIMSVALLLFCYMCDTRYESSFFWLLMACSFIPSLFQGVGYGFAHISRGAINGIWLVGLVYVLKVVNAKSQSLQTVA